MIKDLNLHPSHGANIFKSNACSFDDELKASDSGLAEKRISFPFKILGDSGASVSDLAQHAGYFRIQHTIDARMFYFFFESRRAKADPVVIWLTGGPGCSSELALFYENGPFKLTSNLSLVWNDYGWDKVSNIIFVDQPTGTGFSYSSSDRDLRQDESGVSTDLYNFLQAHPEYVNNDFYITGESYAGHYIPAFASRYANVLLFSGTTDILSVTDNINYYDIRKKCEGNLCYDFSGVESFLGKASVKSALGVPSDIDFVSCSDTVYRSMLNDWMRNLEVGIPPLLDQGIELLVYAGEHDLICNWLGNSRWVHAMSWSRQKDFVAASNVSFLVDGKEAGVLKNHGPLTFLKVHNAGHMVPMDQPRASLKMLELWTTGRLSPAKKGAVAPL
uniref:Carboxypeptidase n=1 Tax=Tanacetum cinerariifolium TaxID=118510 RepID=A0A6L2NC12_TANCI|nr:serine carboxypeptidase-like [Tanacetum cinerariifolium]